MWKNITELQNHMEGLHCVHNVSSEFLAYLIQGTLQIWPACNISCFSIINAMLTNEMKGNLLLTHSPDETKSDINVEAEGEIGRER